MMDSGVYDDSVDLCIYSDSEEDDNLRITDDHCLGKYAKVNLKNIKMGSEANLFTDACLLSRAERALRQVRDSYNDLRIKEETITHGRSDLGPLTGRFDKACRLSKSYYFGTSGNYDTKETGATSDFKKVSLGGLDLDCGSFTKNDDEDDFERLTRTSRKREDFVESLKKLFNSQLSKYGSATGSLCSMTSSDYSSWSNDKSGREESADESNDFPLAEEEVPNNCDVRPQRSASFVDLEHAVGDVEKLRSSVETAVRESKSSTDDVPKDEGVEEDARTSSNKPERRIELDIEETMPKLNWDFLEQQLEKAILKEKSVSSQLRDEILRKMAHEAKNEEDDDDDAGNSAAVDRSKIYRLSCGSCDDLSAYQQSLPPTLLSPAALTSTTTAGFKGVSPLFRRPPRKSRLSAGPINQLQVCFVNELSLEEDEASVTTTLTAPGDTFDRRLGPYHYHHHHHHQSQEQQLFPPSEYSTLSSETFRGEDCDGKSVGLSSQTTRRSSDSYKSSLHPIPALNVLPRSLVDVEDNFFTKQARLQAEARIALAQVRPMSYMQFLLEKQVRREASNVVQYDLPGLTKWSDLRAMCPQRMGGFNITHLKIIINHFLSEITHLNEELMNLLLERDDLYIVQDSMLVDIEDFTRRAEEWEYKKLIRSGQGTTTPPSSPLVCSSPVMTSGSVLGRR